MTATDQQMHQARKRLDRLDEFDGKEEKMTEEEWRERFITLTKGYNPTDPQKLELWREKVLGGSEAHKWMTEMEAQTRIDTWPRLVAELKSRWPPLSKADEAKDKLERWYRDKLEDEKLGTTVKVGTDKTERYHVWWAKERLKLASAVSSSANEKVQITWMMALTPTLKGMLGKTLSDFTTLEQLCAAIISIDQERIEYEVELDTTRRETQDTLAEVGHRLGRMELGRQVQTYQSSRPSNRAGQTTRSHVQFSDSYTTPFQAPRQSIMSAPTTPAPRAFSSFPSTTTTRVQTTTNTPAPTLGAPFTPRSNLPAPAAGRGRTFLDTQEGRTQYNTSLAALQTPATTSVQYPLSPGTMRQTDQVCARCGRGNHSLMSCDGTPLPSEERKWRGAVKLELLAKNASGARTDAFHVMVEEGREEDALELFELSSFIDESENSWGQ
ncbi:hypothetical protein FRC09_001301 [Ceratobasidium sp. 395]|nr:hypothetical protein FRC09_001301 [Ceratobasidium sp. 395]